MLFSMISINLLSFLSPNSIPYSYSDVCIELNGQLNALRQLGGLYIAPL